MIIHDDKVTNILKANCRNTIKIRTLLFSVHFLFITGIANAQQTRVKSKEGAQYYSNPILNKDFADPTVIRPANGKYYAYATQGSD